MAVDDAEVAISSVPVAGTFEKTGDVNGVNGVFMRIAPQGEWATVPPENVVAVRLADGAAHMFTGTDTVSLRAYKAVPKAE